MGRRKPLPKSQVDTNANAGGLGQSKWGGKPNVGVGGGLSDSRWGKPQADNRAGLGDSTWAPNSQFGSAGGFIQNHPARFPQPGTGWGLRDSTWASSPQSRPSLPPAFNAAPFNAPTGPAMTGPPPMDYDRRIRLLQTYKLSTISRAVGIDWRRVAELAYPFNGDQVNEVISQA